MLQQIAEGVWVRVSEFLQTNTTVVRGADGVMVVDPGITRDELAGLADDLHGFGQRIVAGFSTHPDWDHVLWHPRLGDAPRFATALGAAETRDLLTHDDWIGEVAEGLPPEHADDIPMELLGLLTPLPPGAAEVPWNGPRARILEHRAHAPGHAALLIEEPGVLVAGDMLSDTLMPFLDLRADDPLGDYLAALRLFDSIAGGVEVVVPGHGAVGDAAQLRARIAMDRAYVEALRAGIEPDDPRIGPSAPLEWLPDVHRWQVQALSERRGEA